MPPLDAVAIPRRTPERAAKLLDLPKGLAEQINACTAVDHITSPLERDDGSIEVIHGWRAHHFLHRQPVEGASG